MLFWEIHPERCGQYLYIRTPGGSDGKNVPAMQETKAGKIVWRREWLQTPIFLPGEFHGQSSMKLQFIRFKSTTNTFIIYIYIYIYVKICKKFLKCEAIERDIPYLKAF